MSTEPNTPRARSMAAEIRARWAAGQDADTILAELKRGHPHRRPSARYVTACIPGGRPPLDARLYIRSHGRPPRGRGLWLFLLGELPAGGDYAVTLTDANTFARCDSFELAAAFARVEAQRRRAPAVYVLP